MLLSNKTLTKFLEQESFVSGRAFPAKVLSTLEHSSGGTVPSRPHTPNTPQFYPKPADLRALPRVVQDHPPPSGSPSLYPTPPLWSPSLPTRAETPRCSFKAGSSKGVRGKAGSSRLLLHHSVPSPIGVSGEWVTDGGGRHTTPSR